VSVDLVSCSGSDELDMAMVDGGIKDDPHRILPLVPAQCLGSPEGKPEWLELDGHGARVHEAPGTRVLR